MEIVKNSAKDCYPAVQKTTLVIMERLQQVLQMEVSFPPISMEGCAKNRAKGEGAGKTKLKQWPTTTYFTRHYYVSLINNMALHIWGHCTHLFS